MGQSAITRGTLGALVGFVARGGVILMHFGLAAWPLAVPSSVLGILVGWVAASRKSPLASVLIGAGLSALVFEAVLFPLSRFLEPLGALFQGDFTEWIADLRVRLSLEMAAAGALAGGPGWLAGTWLERRIARKKPPLVEHELRA